jgi:hypothetical protein
MALTSARSIEIAAQIKAWKRLEQNLLNRSTVAFQFAEDLRVQRTLLWHRQQSGAGQNLLSQKRRTLQPVLARRKDRHFVVRVAGEDGVSHILCGIPFRDSCASGRRRNQQRHQQKNCRSVSHGDLS